MAKNYRASLRKSGASGKKKALIFQSARTPALRHNEGAPLSTSSQPCNSTALAPRSSRFPYMTYLLRAFAPMAGVAQRFYAVLVISLRSQCRPRWVLPHVPSMLRPGESSPLQHAATRRHRTQTMQFCQIMGEFFRKVSYFAKESASPVFMRVCGSYFAK